MTDFWHVSQIVAKAMTEGDTKRLDELAATNPEILNDETLDVLYAIDLYPLASLKWIVEQGATLDIAVDDGFPPIHSAIDREKSDRYDMVRFLIENGIDIDQRGTGTWTPLHHAAVVHDDVKMVRLLLELGADHELETDIDSYATPEEEARRHGRSRSADAIRDWVQENGPKAT